MTEGESWVPNFWMVLAVVGPMFALGAVVAEQTYDLPAQPTMITATPNSWRQGDLVLVSNGTPLLVVSPDHRRVEFYREAPEDVQVCVMVKASESKCMSLKDLRASFEEVPKEAK